MIPTLNKFLLGAIIVLLGAGAALSLNKYLKPNTQELPPAYEMQAEPKPIETRLFFAGDIMLSRNVGTKMAEANDYTLPYQKIAELVKHSDISFANLESPFNNTGARVTQGLVFKAEPESVEGLTSAGFDVLSTANNHSFDQKEDGIDYTLQLLAENGIAAVGTGLDCHQGIIKEAQGMKFGFLAYSYSAHNDGGKIPDPLVCDWNNLVQIKKDIAALKKQVDFLIVSSHMGTEYKRMPEEANATAARAAIDAGADLFIGHHPHWIQTHEVYKGKYIFYSLGNFIFDQMWSQDTREGLTVEVLFKDKNLSRITLRPIIIDNFCCPRWADEVETKSILSKINLTDPVLLNKND